MGNRNSAILALAAALSAPAIASAAPMYGFSPLSTFGGGDGFIAPGERTYLASGVGNSERGIAYNPLTNRVYVASRTGGNRIAVINGDSGADVQIVPFAPTVGTFALNHIRVADDGAIYVANLTVGSGSATTPFIIYRYADEAALLSGAAPSIAFTGNPLAVSGRLGDTLNIRGAGASTQIIAGAGGTLNNAVVFSTANGTSFTSETFTLPGAANGDAANGVAFGAGNTFYGKQVGDSLRLYEYTPATAGATLLQEYVTGGTSTPLARVGPIDVDLATTLLSGLSITTTGADAAKLYDILNLTLLPELDTETFPFNETNTNVAGAVDFGNNRVYIFDTNNGLLALTIALVPEPGTLGLFAVGAVSLLIRRRKNV